MALLTHAFLHHANAVNGANRYRVQVQFVRDGECNGDRVGRGGGIQLKDSTRILFMYKGSAAAKAPLPRGILSVVHFDYGWTALLKLLVSHGARGTRMQCAGEEHQKRAVPEMRNADCVEWAAALRDIVRRKMESSTRP